jgi:hypothetical protein
MNGPKATSALSPFDSQLRTLVGAVGTAERCLMYGPAVRYKMDFQDQRT